MKRASKKTPLLLSAQSGKGVIEAKRALLEIIEMLRRHHGGTPPRRSPGLAAVSFAQKACDCQTLSPLWERVASEASRE